MTRPRRPLSAEERRLWQEVARSVRPLEARLVEAPALPAGRPEPDPMPPAIAGPSAAPSPPVAPARPALPPLAGIERRVARSLARGHSRPAATLDLHGLTQSDAHRRLIAFLRRAQQDGTGLVLVITGRGGSGSGERGVLRRSVPIWLGLAELRHLVVGFDEAGPRQGGAGALYVRLRKPRGFA